MTDPRLGSSSARAGEYELRPRVWLLVAFAVATFAFSLLLNRVAGFSTTVTWAAPVGGTIGYAIVMRAHVGPAGVRMLRKQCSWEDVVVRDHRWGASLRSRPGVDRSSGFALFLPAYVADWRNDEAISAVRRWAPHLEL